ncbi:MAG: hypothetical protein R6X06_09180, partial [Gammaproteobacteria bacterium]
MTKPENQKLNQVVAAARRASELRDQGYREQALKMYPHICGRCSREFERKNLHELTQAVQHQLHRLARAAAAAGKRRQVQASGWALHQNGTSSSLRGVPPPGGEVQSLPQPPELGAAGWAAPAPCPALGA